MNKVYVNHLIPEANRVLHKHKICVLLVNTTWYFLSNYCA